MEVSGFGHSLKFSQLKKDSRWFYGLFGIMIGIGLIFAFFAAPETRFQRGIVTVGGRRVYTDHFGVNHVVETTEHDDEASNVPAEERGVQDEPFSFAQRLKPYQGLTANAGHVFLDTYVQIAKALLSPGVIFAILLSSIVLGKICSGIFPSQCCYAYINSSRHWHCNLVNL